MLELLPLLCLVVAMVSKRICDQYNGFCRKSCDMLSPCIVYLSPFSLNSELAIRLQEYHQKSTCVPEFKYTCTKTHFEVEQKCKFE